MAETTSGVERRQVLLFLLALPPVMFGGDFVLIVVAYQVLAGIAPDALGEIASSPARFAVWIALLNVPIYLPFLLVVSRRGWHSALTTGHVPDPPVRLGWRRVAFNVRDYGATALSLALATLIVVTYVDDPGAEVWWLVAATAVAPSLLFELVRLPLRLLGWWWRRRLRYQPRHAKPDPPTG